MEWALFVLLVLVIASLGAFWLLKHKIDWHSGETGDLEAPFVLGEIRTVTYSALAKRPRVLADLAATMTLRCEEEVFYDAGTDRVRKAEDLYTTDVAVSTVLADLRVVLEAELEIPSDMPASMDLHNNNFNWILEVHLDPARGMSLKQDFDLSVRPQILGSVRNG